MTEFSKRGLGYNIEPDNIEDTKGGGLLVYRVKLLAQGEWTDSAVQTPLFYPARTLEKYATNWKDASIWSRHSGGQPRPIYEKIGEVQIPHYENSAVVGNLYLHGQTTQSKDVIAMVKAGLINYVSVEHNGEERYNEAMQRMEAESLTFHGLAIVNRGACGVCKIRNNEATPTGRIRLGSSSSIWGPRAQCGSLYVIEDPEREKLVIIK